MLDLKRNPVELESKLIRFTVLEWEWMTLFSRPSPFLLCRRLELDVLRHDPDSIILLVQLPDDPHSPVLPQVLGADLRQVSSCIRSWRRGQHGTDLESWTRSAAKATRPLRKSAAKLSYSSPFLYFDDVPFRISRHRRSLSDQHPGSRQKLLGLPSRHHAAPPFPTPWRHSQPKRQYGYSQTC